MKPSTHSKRYGLIFIALLAVLSNAIVNLPGVSNLGISPLIAAIILGIIFGNTYHHPASWSPGIQFAAKRLLRLAIILYGFRISFQQIAFLGIKTFFIDLFMVFSTLFLGYFIGRKIFKLDRDLSILIGAGSAICGAAAVLAVEDILKSEPYKAAIAIATVVLFGTTAMFLYPFLQKINLLGLSHYTYGIFTGASIHEVAQAIVAGDNISEEAGKVAVVVKMMRVLLLVPVLFLLAFLCRKPNTKSRITIPWFALGFVCVIGINSLHLFSTTIVNVINQIDLILLTMAMGAIGVETKLSKMKQVGIKPFYVALILFIWLIGSASFLVTSV